MEKFNINIKDSSIEQQIKDIIDKLEPLDVSRINFLTSRPWWKNMHNDLQLTMNKIFPGTHLVASPNDLLDLINVNTIIIPNSNYKIQLMEQSRCHDNSLKLYKNDPTLKLFSGYALSGDGLWRHHSWVMTQADDVIETTEKRLIYMGYDLHTKPKS
jgi:hypothetical protein